MVGETIVRVIKQGSSPSLWLTLGTVVLGVLLAGCLNLLLQRAAWKREADARVQASIDESLRQRDTWLREARAAIFRGPLKEVRDGVNNVIRGMESSREPQAQPEWMGLRLSDLERDCSAASGEDGAMVREFQVSWDEIGNVNGSWSQAMNEATPGDARTTMTRRYCAEQLVHWRELEALLKRYDDFVRARLA
jgi:hypothetical protein